MSSAAMCGPALAIFRWTTTSVCARSSSMTLPDKELVEELASGVRAKSLFGSRLRALEAEEFQRTEAVGCCPLPHTWSLHYCNREGLAIQGGRHWLPGLMSCTLDPDSALSATSAVSPGRRMTASMSRRERWGEHHHPRCRSPGPARECKHLVLGT